MKITEFLHHFKTNEPFVIHHGSSELSELRSLPMVDSLETLLSTWQAPVQVHLPDLRDEASAIDVTAGQAMKYFKEGLGLLFNDADRFSPLLQNWVQNIRSELGLSNLTYSRSLIYATPDGEGTAPHFDQNINFVLQIHGNKKWTLARNQSVDNPLERHTMGQAVTPEMMSYLDSPMPEKMPYETQTFELKPGSLLFVPRGVWHSTEAEGHALSLNFTFTAPSWADLLLSALRSRLIASPEWRESALIKDKKKFESLLEMLKNDLPQWQAADILEATES